MYAADAVVSSGIGGSSLCGSCGVVVRRSVCGSFSVRRSWFVVLGLSFTDRRSWFVVLRSSVQIAFFVVDVPYWSFWYSCLAGVNPVNMLFLVGEQKGAGAYPLVIRIPLLANRSMFGV